jgi:RNA polymerase sigma factor (sigma-70 family)
MGERERLENELLVLRCQEGDAKAFEELVKAWQERLWRHAWRLSGDEATAWDVLQETWMAIARGIGRLEDAEFFRGWAYGIVSHKCRDWIRRERRLRTVAEAHAAEGQVGAAEAALTRERLAEVKEAMGRLAGPDRAILCLRYEEGFDTREVARILGVPEGTVKSRLYHARERLRLMMEEGKYE